jgi:hypothetical protein
VACIATSNGRPTSSSERKKEYLAFWLPCDIGRCLETVSLARYFLHTLTSHQGRCMSHVISMHRPGDARQTAVSDWPKIILCLVAPRFEYSSLVAYAKQYNPSALVASSNETSHSIFFLIHLFLVFQSLLTRP